MKISVHELTETDREWVESIFREHWGAEFIVSRGRRHFAADLNGFYACDEQGNRVGLVAHRIDGIECEMVCLNAFAQFGGIGSALVDATRDAAKASGCTRLWLITTNDNIDAIRFYQRRGFRLIAVHANAIEISRLMKPSIPEIGNFGIPLRDELEFEMRL